MSYPRVKVRAKIHSFPHPGRSLPSSWLRTYIYIYIYIYLASLPPSVQQPSLVRWCFFLITAATDRGACSPGTTLRESPATQRLAVISSCPPGTPPPTPMTDRVITNLRQAILPLRRLRESPALLRLVVISSCPPGTPPPNPMTGPSPTFARRYLLLVAVDANIVGWVPLYFALYLSYHTPQGVTGAFIHPHDANYHSVPRREYKACRHNAAHSTNLELKRCDGRSLSPPLVPFLPGQL